MKRSVKALKIAGIISEYNPFHTGHAYHIKMTREAGYTHIISVMSGSTVQRGEVAILNPHSRAQAAVRGGANLVIELPAPYSSASAKDFAGAGVSILSRLGVADALSFGSECGDISLLKACAERMESVSGDSLRALLSQGLTYPCALCEAMGDYGKILSGANNTLAVEYIRALKETGIQPFTVTRTAEHDGTSRGEYASASLIRKMLISGENPEKYLTGSVALSDISDMKKLSDIILYKLASSDEEDIKSAPYTGDGIAERIIKYAKASESLDDLYAAVKTKNVTHAKVRRAVLYAALGVKSEDLTFPPPYARVLAADSRGLELLSEIKKRASIPVSSSLAELEKTSEQAKRCAYLTELSARLRHFAVPEKEYVSEYSYKFKPLIY